MKIAIAGYGAEGESSYRHWNTPENQLVIVDEQQPTREVPVDASIIVGDAAFSKLAGYDMVIRTPGLAPSKISTDGVVWSATNEFFARCPAPIIGVTGSKGKGTTSSLIAGILRAAGHTVHLVGNIGVPALDILPDVSAEDIVVYELSSFQLWDIQRSPQVAVILMVEPDHLDVHSGFDDYVAAKSGIATHQSEEDIIVYAAENDVSVSIAMLSPSQPMAYQSNESFHVSEGYFWYAEHKLCSVDSLAIPGEHNRDNACAAIAAAWRWVQGPDVIARGLSGFTGLPHRLKLVREKEGVRYFDDSIATTPGSAIAAIRAFSEPKIMILGGSSKGGDYNELAAVAASNQVKLAIAIGVESDKFASALERVAVPVLNLGREVTMDQIVLTAAKYAESGDVVILSPACASFDMFTSYIDRGDQFISAAKGL